MDRYKFRKNFDVKSGNVLVKSFKIGDVIEGTEVEMPVMGQIAYFAQTTINGTKYSIPLVNVEITDEPINTIVNTGNSTKSKTIKDYFTTNNMIIGGSIIIFIATIVVLRLGVSNYKKHKK